MVGSWKAGQVHFCSAHNRLQTEGKKRVHARKCKTCKEFLKVILQARLMARVQSGRMKSGAAV